MKHADAATLARLPLVLDALRVRPELVERTPGTFYLKSRAFLHFHDDASGIFADVRLSDGPFTRLRATTRAEQQALLRTIRARLAELAAAAPTQRRGGSR